VFRAELLPPHDESVAKTKAPESTSVSPNVTLDAVFVAVLEKRICWNLLHHVPDWLKPSIVH
jgi:hypothetical protein